MQQLVSGYRRLSNAAEHIIVAEQSMNEVHKTAAMVLRATSNLTYCTTELERAADMCGEAAFLANAVSRDAATIDFGHMKDHPPVGIAKKVWEDLCETVEKNGLGTTTENIGIDIFGIAEEIPPIQKMVYSIHPRDIDAPAVIKRARKVSRDIADMKVALSALSFITDMTDAVKSGRLKAHGIQIKLKGVVMSEIGTRKVVLANA